MKYQLSISILISIVLCFAGCSESSDQHHADSDANHTHDEVSESASLPEEQTHTHADGTTHESHGDPVAEVETAVDSHDAAPLGTIVIGNISAILSQGHGLVSSGKEGHLVVLLPESTDDVATVRAWVGTEDRTLSMVGIAADSTSNRFDIHSVAPSPLPDQAMWWIEIEKDDGTKHIGSIKPLVD